MICYLLGISAPGDCGVPRLTNIYFVDGKYSASATPLNGSVKVGGAEGGTKEMRKCHASVEAYNDPKGSPRHYLLHWLGR